MAVIFILDLCGEKKLKYMKGLFVYLLLLIRSGVTTLALFGTLATQ